MKFPYRKINLKHPFSYKQFILRPIIPVSLKYKDRSIRYEALIDSGADFSIFPSDIAQSLEIDFGNSKRVCFSGIDGDILEGQISEITLGVGKTAVSTKAVFAHVGNGVLGQYGFFDQYIVTFDLKKKIVELQLRN